MIIYLSKGGGLNPPRWMIIYLGGGGAWMPGCRVGTSLEATCTRSMYVAVKLRCVRVYDECVCVYESELCVFYE